MHVDNTNSEANASEFLENLEEMFQWILSVPNCIKLNDMLIRGYNFRVHKPMKGQSMTRHIICREIKYVCYVEPNSKDSLFP